MRVPSLELLRVHNGATTSRLPGTPERVEVPVFAEVVRLNGIAVAVNAAPRWARWISTSSAVTLPR
eukprot:CAMPEP_0119336240 /NCGR_PEP_ID=MMETSP1333-20130426/91390_1 /TAXON_ID=418940 /ORGANISM="Scyphosphaera apsteinii, Strain RCC1455" /LENGTH=65 /DNA_ID=CAMNT_0007346997 /DNA_START=473 /DNA_END=666 /DNA_ORIENTATION=+